MVIEERPQLSIVGTEIMSPFADAMRLVDRDERQLGLADQSPERLTGRALWSNIEQVQLAGLEALNGLFAIRVRRGQRCRAEADRTRASDLVVHQRDQRR